MEMGRADQVPQRMRRLTGDKKWRFWILFQVKQTTFTDRYNFASNGIKKAALRPYLTRDGTSSLKNGWLDGMAPTPAPGKHVALCSFVSCSTPFDGIIHLPVLMVDKCMHTENDSSRRLRTIIFKDIALNHWQGSIHRVLANRFGALSVVPWVCQLSDYTYKITLT